MTQTIDNLRQRCNISSLCTVFEATLHPCQEEGVPRHFVHELPRLVVLDDRGVIQPSTDRMFGVVVGIRRSSVLLPHMEEDLRRLGYRPTESIYLALVAGDPVIRVRMRLLNVL